MNSLLIGVAASGSFYLILLLVDHRRSSHPGSNDKGPWDTAAIVALEEQMVRARKAGKELGEKLARVGAVETERQKFDKQWEAMVARLAERLKDLPRVPTNHELSAALFARVAKIITEDAEKETHRRYEQIGWDFRPGARYYGRTVTEVKDGWVHFLEAPPFYFDGQSVYVKHRYGLNPREVKPGMWVCGRRVAAVEYDCANRHVLISWVDGSPISRYSEVELATVETWKVCR